MHYNISKEVIIKSEYAAKSKTQKSKFVSEFISKLEKEYVVLDYGCGKLRYTIDIAEKVKNVVGIDSINQFQLKQIINGRKISLEEYSSQCSENLRLLPIEKYDFPQDIFDFAICTNVLSAIPNIEDRQIVIKNLKKSIKDQGRILISVQYRNSYFSLYDKRCNAKKHLDGWIINNKSRYSFYGLIRPEILESMCLKENLIIKESIKRNGSIFLILTK